MSPSAPDEPPRSERPAPETPAAPPTRAPYEGPFKRRALEKARAESGAEAPASSWRSTNRLYLIGVVIALGISAFYVSKLMVRPAEILRSADDKSKKAPAPEPQLRAYCLRVDGTLAKVEPRPFCTAARPPSCLVGETLALTYHPHGTDYSHVHVSVVDERLRPTVVATAEAVRREAKDAPVGRWSVATETARAQVAVVGLFSRAPLTTAEVAPFFEAWKVGVPLLARPPELPATLVQKGAHLAAFLACVGREAPKPTAPPAPSPP